MYYIPITAYGPLPGKAWYEFTVLHFIVLFTSSGQQCFDGEVSPKGSHVWHLVPACTEFGGNWGTLGTCSPARNNGLLDTRIRVIFTSGFCPRFLPPESPRDEHFRSPLPGQSTQVNIFLHHGGLQPQTESQNKPILPSVPLSSIFVTHKKKIYHSYLYLLIFLFFVTLELNNQAMNNRQGLSSIWCPPFLLLTRLIETLFTYNNPL